MTRRLFSTVAWMALLPIGNAALAADSVQSLESNEPVKQHTSIQAQQASAASGSSAERVAAALDRMDAWLGSGDNGNRWRQFLDTAALRAEIAKGDEADPNIVSRALHRFGGAANGLSLAPFAAVRQELSGWLPALKSQYNNNLERLAWASRGDHTPVSPEQFEEVRSEMRNRAQDLERALGGSSPRAQAWKKYLSWDSLTPHLEAGYVADRRALGKLDTVLLMLRANQPGLELPVFVNLAKAIAKYRGLASWASAARTRDSGPEYARLVEGVGTFLQRHLERPTTETAWRIGRSLGIVDLLGQSPELVAGVRTRLAQPNIVGAVSVNLIRRLPNRNVQGVRQVRDCILGVAQFGTAHTNGAVRYEVEPSNDSAVLAVYLTGEANSRTRGYKKPARVNAASRTTFHATKNVLLNDDKFFATPAVAHADTRSRILSVQKTGGRFGHKLVEKIGWQRAHEQKRSSEIVAAQHAEERVEREFNEIVARDLANLRLRYEDKIQNPLIRRGVTPEHMELKSTQAAITLEALFATRSQLGADRPPPNPMPNHDIQVQIHESAVSNYLPLAFSAVRIAQQSAETPPELKGNVPNWIKLLAVRRPKLAAAANRGAEMVEQAQETVGNVQEALGNAVGGDDSDDEKNDADKKQESAPPFKAYSITLNSEAPVSVRFDDGKVAIRVRASKLATDDAEYTNWDFIVTYRITVRDDRIFLERVGDIEVFPTGFDPQWDKQLTAQQSGFRSTLAKNMNARAKAGQSFPAEIPIEPVRVSRFGVLMLEELVADDGWLTIGWRLPDESAIEPDPGELLPAAG